MPKYQVIEPVFMDGMLCGPGTSRTEITRSEPIPKEKLSAGLVLIKESKQRGRRATVSAKNVPPSFIEGADQSSEGTTETL